MSADRLAAGKTGNGLVYNCLENGSGQILFGGTVIDQRLDIRSWQIHRSGLRWDKALYNFSRIRSSPVASVCKKRGHLVNEGTGTAGADTVHTLFNIAACQSR